MKGETVKNVEVIIKRSDGQKRWVLANAAPVLNEKGEVIAGVVVFPDITDLVKAENELKNSEARLKILFDYAPDAYFLTDLKGNFIDGNKAAEELSGYQKDELIGENYFKTNLLSKVHFSKSMKLLKESASGHPTGPDEFTLTQKSGKKVDIAPFKELYPFKSNWLTINGLKYHYLDEGPKNAPTLIMVHGNPTWSFYYRNLITEFSDRYRVIVPDHIGCGLSLSH